MSQFSRRSMITGLISFVAAPAIVRVESIMPVKVMAPSDFNDAVRRVMVDFAFKSVEPVLLTADDGMICFYRRNASYPFAGWYCR